MSGLLAAVAVFGLALAACDAAPSAAPTDASGTLALPTVDTRTFQACAGVGTEAVLAGDADDPRVAWLMQGATRVDVVFPYGFRARFTPGLEVLNASGALVARAGDRIDGGCVTAGALLILWPPVPLSSSLAMGATGLGPCTRQWYVSCNYGIRVEGPGGYDHRGNFAWDEGRSSPGPEPAHGPAGPVASTGIWGDVPATLAPGAWTISFRLWYGSDSVQLVPVPGGTPRALEEDPFTAACSTRLDTTGVSSVILHVALNGIACTVESELGAPNH